MGRHSKLQLQVLSLYRNLLRVARSKPGATEYVQYEFRKNASISKTEVMRIEHLLRRGERQLEGLKKSSTSGIGLFHYESNNTATKWPLYSKHLCVYCNSFEVRTHSTIWYTYLWCNFKQLWISFLCQCNCVVVVEIRSHGERHLVVTKITRRCKNSEVDVSIVQLISASLL